MKLTKDENIQKMENNVLIALEILFFFLNRNLVVSLVVTT